MKRNLFLCCLLALAATASLGRTVAKIPLPEHPRPDFERSEWINLNGPWAFTFNEALAQKALQTGQTGTFDHTINVPFPWGSPLSDVANLGDSAWYARQVSIPESWRGKRVFLIIGAADWGTKVWLNGRYLGAHEGGYTPFEFELTPNLQFGMPQNLVIGVEDKGGNDRLAGKQGYGNARGIWQTVYLEARGNDYIDYVHFTPDIDRSAVKVQVGLNGVPAKDATIRIKFKNGEQTDFTYQPKGKAKKSTVQEFEIPLSDQRLWELDDPYLYETTVSLYANGQPQDQVDSYFGQRKISTTMLPGSDYPYVALNNKPVYLQLCLDQSYHPEGYYTFPSDEFMRDEILLSKRLGLNGNRIHIKVEVPRKLYWADKLGLLVMADTPNFWGEPTDSAKKDWEHCMRAQVKRDYNHPSIFSWVNFNETWGLFTNTGGTDEKGKPKRAFLPETQEWVRNMYHETKKLDPSRLVEDNSPCNEDHVQTDLNTWHGYHPGYQWEETIAQFDDNTYPGSTHNYIGGNRQGGEPMFNSECGNVWGYKGSTGDVDFTWDYHIMMNGFRSHPKVCGWLYTEHHDVINEWNGYVKYDRSPKIDGLSDLVPGMTMADFHSLYYIVPKIDLCSDVKGGSTVAVPLVASFMTDKNPGALILHTKLVGWDQLGRKAEYGQQALDIPFTPYLNGAVGEVSVDIPKGNGLYLLQMQLTDQAGKVLHRNFVTFVVKDGDPVQDTGLQCVSFAPASFSARDWSVKQWNVLDGLKVNGTGSGYFEYTIPWPAGLKKEDIAAASLVFEASAKQLFGKDLEGIDSLVDLDFMRGGGTHDPCKSTNSYAMTDQLRWESWVTVSVNGQKAGSYWLEDDPADHRGILSWHAQPHDNYLREAGSYGYLIEAALPLDALKEGEPIVLRLAVPDGITGGMALYGADFGRYPLDPTLVFTKKTPPAAN